MALHRSNAMHKGSSLEKQMSRSQLNRKFIDDRLKSFNPRMDRLRDLDLFVLDNSIRETTVGQLRGHTLEDKFAIYNEVKKCGFTYCIVEAFHSMTRVGDKFLELLKNEGEDMSRMFVFTDFADKIVDGMPQDDLPIGYIKSKKFGIKNVIIEVDLAYYGIDYKKFNKNAMYSLLVKRFLWVYKELGEDAKILVNIRDWGDSMNFYPCRVFRLLGFMAKLPEHCRPFGVMVEELGKYLPEEVAVWVEALRREMDDNGWTNAHLLAHVHEQWGMADTTQLDMLARGANGIWAGVCEEGAAMGHASSCITIMNLIRLGNTKVLEKYNCVYLREAAVNVTRITTGHEPRPKQPVYGIRSLDLIFGLDATKSRWDFNFADFLGIKPEMRITTLAAPEMFVMKLKEYFGENDQFTLEMAMSMKEKMLEKLRSNVKEEANSMVGLAMLFDQSGGQLTENMASMIEADKSHSVHIDGLITKIKERWDVWDSDDGTKDDQITFDAFYNGFMAPYFGCYRCEDTQKGLEAIDMDDDGLVDWNEFALYLKWAGRQYPDCKNEEELLDMSFRKGLIPAMQDVLLPDIHKKEQPSSHGKKATMGKSRTQGPALVTKRNTITRRTPEVFYDQQVQPDAYFGRVGNSEADDQEMEEEGAIFGQMEALSLQN